MHVLKAENIILEIDGMTISQGVNIELRPGEKAALIGDNGSGKTTFLHILLGKHPYSSGSVSLGVKKEEVGWMLEEPRSHEATVRSFVEQGNENFYSLKLMLAECGGQWEHEGGNPEFIERYNSLLQEYSDRGGYEWELRVERVMKEMRIDESLWGNRYSSLSGGQKTRLRLARLLINQPKLLVLDEPTNHLDVESVEWLAKWLQAYKGTVLFISHEREFIDQVATVTYELTDQGTKRYSGGYSQYRRIKEQEQKAAAALYQKQQREKKKLLEIIQGYKQWYQKASNAASVRNPFAQKQAGRHAVQLKSKEKALEKLESRQIQKPKEGKAINASFVGDAFESKTMIMLEKVSFSYNEQPIFHNVSLQIIRGERIAVTGVNGSGKTTLLKLLTGQIAPNSGEVKQNPQTKIGYFMQELESLNPANSILEEILSLKDVTQEEARTILACFLFRRDEVYKQIQDLSMGEKCRVAFVKLYFSDANLLVLDEPTNYLDISAREQIETALLSYHGSVVIVSHDPFMLRRIATRVIALERGVLHDFPGNFEQWEGYEHRNNELQNLKNTQLMLEARLESLVNSEGQIELNELLKVKRQIDEIKKQTGNP
ncbi:ribosomal protection-like ABC-F family protein [Peribacillus sp. SCS-155]|uniref:ribosomal protection-like ABC-F family protein n=1 Tax=Peribacillus sedimenti TaxID=3115297 RepID=UPI003906408E